MDDLMKFLTLQSPNPSFLILPNWKNLAKNRRILEDSMIGDLAKYGYNCHIFIHLLLLNF
jgi:hypothetical protein